MNAYLIFSHWIFEPYTWLILGLLVIIIDIFLGFVLLPFGIAALVIAGLIFSDQNMIFGDFIFFETWRDVLIYYAVLSLCSVGMIKLIFQKSKKGKSDINQY